MMKMVDGVLVEMDADDVAQAQADAARPAPAVPSIIFKADIWRRCTDDEAATLDAALEQAPARLRRIFDGAQYLDTTDPDYPAIRDAVIAALGQTRAAVVLAPS